MESMNPQGWVKITVYDKYGKIKSRTEGHNVITAQGDAYIADLLSLSPQRQKINATNCFVAVGTGYTGANNKNQTWVNTQVGVPQAVDALYPQLAGAWGFAGQNQLNFQFTFTAGTLNATGINEACILSANVQGLTTTCLAYAQCASTNVSITDQLIVDWQIIFYGN